MTVMTLSEAADHMVATDPAFALTTASIRGEEYKVFKNVPRSLPQMLEACRAEHGDGADDFIVFHEECWSYDAYCRDVARAGHMLVKEFGIGPGDRVAIAMRNLPELLILMMAIPSTGAVVVFLNGWWTTSELDYALADSGAKLIFADGQRLERLLPLQEARGLTLVGVREAESAGQRNFSELLPTQEAVSLLDQVVNTDDDFAIMYSSGTTGHPKGVVQTHRGAISAVYSWLMTTSLLPLIVEADDTVDAPDAPQPSCLIVTPLFHVTATHPMFLLAVPYGAKIVLMGRWDAHEAVRLIEKEKITRFLGVPTQTADLLRVARETGASLSTLDFIGSGGAKRPAPDVAPLQEAFPAAVIASGWGMTETNAIGLGIMGADYVGKPGSAGRLYPPLQELKILDDEGDELLNGAVGEITVRSAANMRCYLNKPEATDEVLSKGWLRTGDLGMIDDEGYVTIVDRKKNIIIRGGENIACLDVEGAIHRHPDVIEAAAFSVPDDRLGELVGVAVQLRDRAVLSEADLSEFLKDHLAKYKIPERYWFQSEPLLRGATDKTDRRAMRAKCLGVGNSN